MALDGIFLRHLKRELEEKLIGGRVDKIHQPNREELVIAFRTRESAYKVLLSARANSARVHFTSVALENPKQPPMLCMLPVSYTHLDVYKRQVQLRRRLFLFREEGLWKWKR